MAALRPTIFASVPRLYNRIYDKWVECNSLWVVSSEFSEASRMFLALKY